MKYLLDTNVLTRSAEPGHAMYPAATGATQALLQAGHELFLVPQVLYEFWVVCTRPAAQNGLGFTPAEPEAELNDLLSQFPKLDDMPGIFDGWKTLVTAHGVAGKEAHDARLVAAMHVHGITHLLSFNSGDFQRYPIITVVSPDDVLKVTP